MDTITNVTDGSGTITPQLPSTEGTFSPQARKYYSAGAGVGVLLISLSGSGSNTTFPVAVIQKTGSAVIMPSGFSTANTDAMEYLTAQEQIEDIKYHLGISITDLAKLLHVQRPAVYDWLNGVAPRPTNRERIQNIHRIAKQWSSISNQNLKSFLHAPIETGTDTTIIDLLKADTLDSTAISQALESIALHIQERLSKINRQKKTGDGSQLTAFEHYSRRIAE